MKRTGCSRARSLARSYSLSKRVDRLGETNSKHTGKMPNHQGLGEDARKRVLDGGGTRGYIHTSFPLPKPYGNDDGLMSLSPLVLTTARGVLIETAETGMTSGPSVRAPGEGIEGRGGARGQSDN